MQHSLEDQIRVLADHNVSASYHSTADSDLELYAPDDPGHRRRPTLVFAAVALLVVVIIGVTAVVFRPWADDGSSPYVSTGPEMTLAPTEWAVAELVGLPDGLEARNAEDNEAGRLIGYNRLPRDLHNFDVSVMSSDPEVRPLVDAIDQSLNNSLYPGTVTEVRGHPALVRPATDGGQVFGYEVVWDERPDLQITVLDSRYEQDQPIATPESALALVDHVQGMTEAQWELLTGSPTGEFCSLVAAGADVPESYIGSTDHHADIASMLAVAPLKLRTQLQTLLDFLDSGAIDPNRPDAKLIENWPPTVQSATGDLSRFSSDVCGVETPG